MNENKAEFILSNVILPTPSVNLRWTKELVEGSLLWIGYR